LGRTVEYLTFSGDAGSGDAGQLSARIARRVTDGTTVGETFALELAGFALDFQDELICVLDLGQMEYQWGHHNWDETATITHQGTEYVLTLRYYAAGAPEWTDELTATGVSVWGPLRLTATACSTDPPNDANFCMGRP
jgi:hypothetical protein